jgi:hypothetical protein
MAEKLYGKSNKKREINIKFFRDSFDCWHGVHKKYGITAFFESVFAHNNYEKGKVVLYDSNINLFLDCCNVGGNIPFTKALYLYSIVVYLLNKDKIAEHDFKRRIRIIRNLILNSSDEIRRDNMSALLNESEYIILNGNMPEKGDGGYNTRQKEEEQNKINWLKTNPGMTEELFQLEDHVLLKGCVAIIGLGNSENFGKFRHLFDNCSGDLIDRALLLIGDYSQKLDKTRTQLVSKNMNNWVDLFHPSKNRQGFDKTSETLNKLLSRLDETEINNSALEKLVETYLHNPGTPKDWKYYFVKYYPIRNSGYGMYHWKYDRSSKPYEVLIMNTEVRLTGLTWDFFLNAIRWNSGFEEKLYLGDYAYYGDKLKIIGTDIELENQNDKFVFHRTTEEGIVIEEKIITQSGEGIDLEDRVQFGIKLLDEIIMKKLK